MTKRPREDELDDGRQNFRSRGHDEMPIEDDELGPQFQEQQQNDHHSDESDSDDSESEDSEPESTRVGTSMVVDPSFRDLQEEDSDTESGGSQGISMDFLCSLFQRLQISDIPE